MPFSTTKRKNALTRLLQRPVLFFRHLFGFRSLTDVRRSGFRWRLDLREDDDFEIYLVGAFGLQKMTTYWNFLRPGAIVLDVGAKIGAHALPLAHLVGPTGHVFAFEPGEGTSQRLRTNLTRNPEIEARVTVVAGGFPDTIDAYLAEAGVTDVDFVRLDLDGEECAVLRGAMRTLKSFRPLVLLGIVMEALEEKGESLDSLLAILGGAGYALADARHDTVLAMNERALRKGIPGGKNYYLLAIPEELLESL